MARVRMHDHEFPVSDKLARGLVQEQFPHWAALALREVEVWGTDNAIWRLGDELVVRLPRVASASNQPAMEDTWLPALATYLPVAVPEPVGLGVPSADYPYAWSVHGWLPGVSAGPDTIEDPTRFALRLIEVIRALGQVPVDGAPDAINRARPLAVYDRTTRAMIDSADGLIDTKAALAIWEDGLAADPYEGALAWVHGDLEGNCLVSEGELSGLIDWGCACVGDPAVDLQVAWSPLFSEESRAVFLDELNADDSSIRRAKAMAINQACGALPYYLHTYPLIVERSWHKLRALGVGS